MKFNDYFKKNKISSRNIEISGVNNNTENINNSSIKNKTVMNSSNRLRSIIHEQNLALPKNKKYTITKGNGCLMKQLRTKGLSPHQETNNSFGNIKNNISENYRQFQSKGIIN